MTTMPFLLRPQTPADLPAIKQLHATVFGPGRFARTAYRVRENGALEPDLCLAISIDERLAGAIHFAPVTIGGRHGALLLGPLAIAPDHVNQGWGLKLILEGLARGKALGYSAVVLVGDLPYYARAGFERLMPGRFWLPGPADPSRLLGVSLQPGALNAYGGLIQGAQPLRGVGGSG